MRIAVAGPILLLLLAFVACVGSDPGNASTQQPGTDAAGGSFDASGATTTLDCRQKDGADTDSECADRPDKPRKLDCDSGDQTDSAIAAGCVRVSSGASDVCCPTSVRGRSEGEPPSETKARAAWELAMSGSTTCTSLPKLTFGTFTPEKLVENGEQVGSATASVVCSVKTSTGSGDFTVSGLASTAGGVSINVSGNVDATSPGGTITGTFIWPDGTTFTRSNCAVTYSGGGGVALGRIWARLDCPGTGTGIPNECAAVAQLKFENCAQ